MYMVMLVLNNPNQLDALLAAWEAVGVSGVTILETTGAHRRKQQHIGARYLFAPMVREDVQHGNYTLLTAVPDEETMHRCIEVADEIVGGLDGPHTGVLCAWELAVTRGIPTNAPRSTNP